MSSAFIIVIIIIITNTIIIIFFNNHKTSVGCRPSSVSILAKITYSKMESDDMEMKMDGIDIEEQNVLEHNKFLNLSMMESGQTYIKDLQNDHPEARNGYNFYDPEAGTWKIKTGSICNIIGSNEYQTSNKIILGSKPYKVNSMPLGQQFSDTDTNTLNPISQDCTSEAENSDRFCSLCNRLCKTPYDLETHKQAVHSLLKVVGNVAMQTPAKLKKTARKSTTPRMTEECDVCFQTFNNKTALYEHKNMVHDNSRILCDHCEVYFPSGDELLKHLSTALKKKNFCDICNVSFDSHRGLVNHNRTHLGKNTTNVLNETKKVLTKAKSFSRVYQCQICNFILPKRIDFIKHMSQHKVFKPELIPVVYDGKCKHCGSLKHINDINKHILYTHPIAVKKKVGIAKRACHNIKFHSERTENIRSKPEQLSLIFKQVLTDEFKDDTKTLKYRSAKSVYKVSEAKILDNPPVPNSILFKCNICAAHFMTCMKALSHRVNCVQSTKGKKTCPKCGKIFPHSEFKLHKLQHNVTSKFKVYLTHNNMSARIVCLCPYCNLHFVEAKFWKHLLDGCSWNKNSDMCKICHLKFSPASFKEHCFSHTEKRLVREDYIIIDFFKQENTEVFQKEKQLKDKDPNTEGMLAPMENSIFAHGRYVHVRTEYYFCKLCSSYIGKTLQGKLCHMRSINCKKSKRHFCETCGLTFQNNAWTYHTPMHTIRQDLTVRKFTFFTFSDKKIIPPLPQFPTCVKCQCVILKTYGHKCTWIKSIYCNICNKSFAQDAYKLHMDFHFVRGEVEDSKVISIPGPSKSSNRDEIPELLRKYDEGFSTVWHIVFVCASCGIATVSYDNAVNHCQEHILRIFSSNDVRRCSNCNLKFEYKCMEKHKQYHLQTVCKVLFNIIKYDFNKMVESNWLLNSLSQEQMQQIVSRSIFKHTRFIRMKVLSGNSSDIILYKCFTCLKYINPIDVENHSRKSCDSSKKSYKCFMCKIDFDSKFNCDEHERLHIETQRHKFKIVAFNDEGDRKYDEILQEASHESQKRFRSEKEKAQINYTDSEVDLVDQMNVAIPKRYAYYQCTKCKLHIRNKFQFHRCYSVSMSACHICGLNISLQNIKVHIGHHERDPNFRRENYDIYEFDPASYVQTKVSVVESVETVYKCVCDVYFTSESRAQSHFDVCNTKTEIPSEHCKTCGFMFYEKYWLDHIKLHHTENKYQFIAVVKLSETKAKHKVNCCGYCGVVIAEKGRTKLFVHIRDCGLETSTIINGNKCNLCGLIFNQFSSLEHEELHEQYSNKGEVLTAEDFQISTIYHVNRSNPIKKDSKNVAPKDLRIETYEDSNKGLKKVNISTEPGQVTLFRCSKNCKINFYLRSHLRSHFNKNHETESVICQFCNLDFGPVTLPRHIEKYHKDLGYTRKNFVIEVNDLINNKLVCISKITYNGENDIITEVKERDDETDNEISVSVNSIDTSVSKKRRRSCSPTLFEIPKLTYHSRFAFDLLFVYRCNKCTVCFNYSQAYYYHLVAGCKVTDFKTCNKCGLTFRGISLRRHTAAHSMNVNGNKMYIINFNDAPVRWKHEEFNVTNLVYTKYTLFKCMRCNGCYCLISSLIDHCIKKHKQKRKTFSCTSCDLVFMHYESLASHMKLHHTGEYQVRNYHFVTDRDIKEILDDIRILKKNEEKHVGDDADDSALDKCDDVDVESKTDADNTMIEENLTISNSDSIRMTVIKHGSYDGNRNIREKD